MLLCLGMTAMCVVPLIVLLLNSLILKDKQNQLVQLCAVHFVWNAHVIGHAAMALPFLAMRSSHESYWLTMYDLCVFWIFVCAPLEMSTGIVKSLTSKRKIRFCWRHRAVLGVLVCQLTTCYFFGTYYVRPSSFKVTASCTFLFYAYAGSSYLPANPQGDGPEITGSREWPWLKTFLRPILWDPIFEYMRLRVLAADDADVRRTFDVNANDAALERVADTVARARNELRQLYDSETMPPSSHKLRRADEALENAARLVTESCCCDRAASLLQADEAALFGYHVHGIIPLNAALMTLHPDFVACANSNRVVLATDAMTHVVCWMRDLGQWLGVRECTRDCIARTLKAGTSVVLVPGGQAEMLCNRSDASTISMYVGHRGFIKLALQLRTRLVPVFAFGEWTLMDNISLFPSLQRFTRRIFGVPFPFLPYGALPGIPRRPTKGITLVVGKPLDPEPYLAAHQGQVTPAAVQAAHDAYYRRLENIFQTYKHAAGYPDIELRKIDYTEVYASQKHGRRRHSMMIPPELARDADSCATISSSGHTSPGRAASELANADDVCQSGQLARRRRRRRRLPVKSTIECDAPGVEKPTRAHRGAPTTAQS